MAALLRALFFTAGVILLVNRHADAVLGGTVKGKRPKIAGCTPAQEVTTEQDNNVWLRAMTLDRRLLASEDTFRATLRDNILDFRDDAGRLGSPVPVGGPPLRFSFYVKPGRIMGVEPYDFLARLDMSTAEPDYYFYEDEASGARTSDQALRVPAGFIPAVESSRAFQAVPFGPVLDARTGKESMRYFLDRNGAPWDGVIPLDYTTSINLGDPSDGKVYLALTKKLRGSSVVWSYNPTTNILYVAQFQDERGQFGMEGNAGSRLFDALVEQNKVGTGISFEEYKGVRSNIIGEGPVSQGGFNPSAIPTLGRDGIFMVVKTATGSSFVAFQGDADPQSSDPPLVAIQTLASQWVPAERKP